MTTPSFAQGRPHNELSHWLNAFRQLALPAILFWFYAVSSFFVGGIATVPEDPSICRGAWLCFDGGYNPISWPLALAILSLFCLCCLFVIGPSRKSLFVALSCLAVFFVFEQQLANYSVAKNLDIIIVLRPMFSFVQLILFAMLSMSITVKHPQRWWVLGVGMGLIGVMVFLSITALIYSFDFPLKSLYMILGALIWPSASAFREWVGRYWTNAHKIVFGLVSISSIIIYGF